jgi:FkbM family methyltransferase
MQNVGGVWLPPTETHLTEWMRKRNHVVNGKLTYQYHKLEAALSYVRQWRTAIDVGGHCGLWSMHLVEKFARVVAFEPVELHRECFERNVPGIEEGKCILVPVALGEQEDFVSIHTAETSSGDSWVSGKGEIPLKRLDPFGFTDVDFIKLDCEGYELFALRGGEETLKRCKPVVCVEQKPNRAEKFGLKRTQAVDYLQGLGAKLRKEIGGDYILSWE